MEKYEFLQTQVLAHDMRRLKMRRRDEKDKDEQVKDEKVTTQ
jgi:hypothetical protein